MFALSSLREARAVLFSVTFIRLSFAAVTFVW
jgi:hypothetical protein